MVEFVSVYITARDLTEAKAIAKELVTDRLAACVNVIEKIHSFYWWESEVQEDQEAALIAKTKESLVSELIERVRSMHSYDCPCIVTTPIKHGHPAFLDWIREETR